MNKNVCVVIVTFNRKNYLLNVLNAIKNQTVSVNKIVIIDNFSTDGTENLLQINDIISQYTYDDISLNNWNNIKIIYYKSSVNTGGSGGFKKGFEIALNEECDYIWAMDDDVYPQTDCLYNLLSSMSDKISVCVPNRNCNGYVDRAVLDFNWTNPFRPIALKKTTLVNKNKENILIKDFAFEGPLFKKELIQKIGVPNSNYFIFFDDSDFAQRCLKFSDILYVSNAYLKKQIIPNNTAVVFNWRSYYVCRNEIIFDRTYNPNKFVATIRPFILFGMRIIKYCFKRNRVAIKYSYLAFKHGRKNITGKTIEPGSF